MTFQDMVYLCQVAKHQSYSKAAQELFVSQPVLSHSVHTLEQELSTQIFRREGHCIVLTEDGKLVLQYVEKILDIQHNIYEHFSHAANQQLPVTVVLTAIINPLFGAMAELAYLPGLRLEQIMVHRDYLRHHPWDIVLFSAESPPIRGDFVVLKREEFCFVVSAEHSLADEPSLTLDQVANAPLILPPQHNEVGNILRELFRTYHFKPNIEVESDDYFSYPQFLQRGLIGVIPSYSTSLQDTPSLKLIPWKGCERCRLLCLTSNPNKELSPYALHVKNHIIQYFHSQ